MIFITGGVRSGKSAFAEQLAARLSRRNYYYIATGQAFDEEMRERILRHQQDRAHGEVQWQTLEMSTMFSQQKIERGDVVLFECVTTWLGNVQYESSQHNKTCEPYVEHFKQQCKSWQHNGVTAIIVSNELLDEPSSHYEEVNTYRRALGELHQWLVTQCEQAYEVDHQLVKQWK